jgi:ABC-type nitrate/sulfonate/bicarbonate transport system permease component
VTRLRRLTTSVVTIIALPTAIVVAWWYVSSSNTDPFWPPLSDIVDAFGPTWLEGRFGRDGVPSILRMLAGFGIALVLGVAGGLLIGSFTALRDYAEPLLEFFRAVPPPVLIPVVMLFAGIGDTMKVLVIAFGCLWPILLNTVEGVRGIDEVLSDTARTYRLDRVQRVRDVVLRGASPNIAVGARQALSLAVILMVISEMFAASNGIGFTIVQFQRNFEIAAMWSGILLLGLIGVSLALVFNLIERRSLRWYHGLRRTEGKS